MNSNKLFSWMEEWIAKVRRRPPRNALSLPPEKTPLRRGFGSGGQVRWLGQGSGQGG